jgi:hypothetical protein
VYTSVSSLTIAPTHFLLQQKHSLINNISNAIETIDTDDFGIRIIVIKTKE